MANQLLALLWPWPPWCWVTKQNINVVHPPQLIFFGVGVTNTHNAVIAGEKSPGSRLIQYSNWNKMASVVLLQTWHHAILNITQYQCVETYQKDNGLFWPSVIVIFLNLSETGSAFTQWITPYMWTWQVSAFVYVYIREYKCERNVLLPRQPLSRCPWAKPLTPNYSSKGSNHRRPYWAGQLPGVDVCD